MSSRKRTSSGSEDEERYAMMDEKKRRRMISNRESARRSRQKREKHITDLNEELVLLQNSSNEMMRKIDEVTQRYVVVESENRILRAQREELSKRLESAEMVYGYLCVGTGSAGVAGQAQAQDPWLKPWQPSVQSLPIMTSAGFFQF